MVKVHVDFDREANIKKRIKESLYQAVEEENMTGSSKTNFGMPIIGYADTKHPLYHLFMEEGLTLHPKGIYRPGNTAISFFLPYSKEVVISNKGGNKPSDQWTQAFFDSMHLVMKLNRIIGETLDQVGRLHSPANTPMDWNFQTHREEWSHKLAGYIAGLGRFAIGSSFHTELGFCGRWSTVFTDEKYAPFDADQLKRIDLENIINHIETDSKTLGADDVKVSQQAIDSCPGGAISKDGISKALCQDYCSTVNPNMAGPEVCGKCFYYDC